MARKPKNETIRLIMNLGPLLTGENHQKKVIEAGVHAYYNNIFKEIDILVTR